MREERVIDANVNRAQEGLRVLEDVARLVLDDAALAGRAKAVRHALTTQMVPLSRRLLAARRADEDRAAFLDPPIEMRREDLGSLVAANARRVQEALRSLEEYAKLPAFEGTVDAAALKRLRFQAYTLEKDLAGRLQRHEQRQRLAGLYVILAPEVLGERDILAVAQGAVAGGAAVLQLRDKQHGKARQLELSRALQRIATQGGALFFVNDHLDVAMLAGADGVHLGQQDIPVAEARRILPPGVLIGCSTNNVAEALQAQADGADYVSVGCLFPTQTKGDTRPATLDILRQVKEAVRLPVCAIGGINGHNIAEVSRARADMAAVISAVCAASDVPAAARSLSARFAESGMSPGQGTRGVV